MSRVAQWALARPMTVAATWLLLLVLAVGLSARLPDAIRASTDGIPDSPSERAMRDIARAFGPESGFVFPVVVQSASFSVRQHEFGEAMARLERSVVRGDSARQARHYWNSGAGELLGADGHSALLLVAPRAASFREAELRVAAIREDLRAAGLDDSFTARVTGPVAVFHDMNRHSAEDLLVAERIGIPITLAILLLVFGAPVAAGLPIAIAFVAVTVSLAVLYLLSFWMPVSVFARNAVTMIGLGVGVDYALFILARYREELAGGEAPRQAVARAVRHTAGAVVYSGLTVAAGFLALLLVRVPMMHSLALGGAVVVAVSVALALTLLPVALVSLGAATYWPFASRGGGARSGLRELWSAWARFVMRRPWLALIPALVVLALFVAPVFQMNRWNPGASDLPATAEARKGAEALKANFGGGWLGPMVLSVAAEEGNVWRADRQDAVLAIAGRLAKDERVSLVAGFPAVLAALGPMRSMVASLADLPPAAQPLAADAVSVSGAMALIVVIPRAAPESEAAMRLANELRRDAWPEALAAGLTVGVSGASAGIADFDEELFGSLWRVIPAVLAATFVTLLAMFRSILIPLKATVLNLCSVLAAWGFLVLVFQLGIGAAWIGLEPPGGLNAFIVLMLFTILFGLSMDYEVFLLSRIREERERGADDATAVARALQGTGATITSAALVMVCIFGSFAFTRLTATREFGVGLAFAVALDATVVRLVLVPALMRLLGAWNWWLPAIPCTVSRRRIKEERP